MDKKLFLSVINDSKPPSPNKAVNNSVSLATVPTISNKAPNSCLKLDKRTPWLSLLTAA